FCHFGGSMKWKNSVYWPRPWLSASVRLTTMALFQRDADGELIYAQEPKRKRRLRNPRGEERRRARRYEWRHDSVVWTVTGQGRELEIDARTCDLSAGGCSVLLDQEIPPGSFLDLQMPHLDQLDEVAEAAEADEAGEADEATDF